MPTLSISNFSCIERAEIDLAPLVVLIGPQASGKSVISKLVDFLGGLSAQMITDCRAGRTYREFKAKIEHDFLEQFPAATWGSKYFDISYEAGEFQFSVGRKETTSRSDDRVVFESSDSFKHVYTRVLRGYRKAAGPSLGSDDNDDLFFQPSDTFRAFDRRIRRQLARDMGDLFIVSQLFVPAGRAFFTSLGSVFSAFERGGILDPVTRRFGALFAFLRDSGRRRARLPRRPGSRELVERNQHESLGRKFFGGEIKLGKEREYIESEDGRKIPLSVLSSGQQELLPLWLSLELYADQTRNGAEGINEIFIEEPEAHLFPSTQSSLIEYLATLIGGSHNRNRMFITTHSPYVLSKINNLMFAFEVGQAPGVASKVDKVVPRSSWVNPSRTRAYALQLGNSKPIIRDGLVDAAYLDAVSSDLSKEFDRLLALMA